MTLSEEGVARSDAARQESFSTAIECLPLGAQQHIGHDLSPSSLTGYCSPAEFNCDGPQLDGRTGLVYPLNAIIRVVSGIRSEFNKAWMEARTQFLKSLIRRTLSPGLQQKLRRLYLVRRVLQSRGPEEPEGGALKELVCAGDSVADLGANIGLYTIALSSLVGQNGCVYSCEPISENYQILESVVNQAQLSNVKLFRAAVGSRVGKRNMVIPELGDFRGYFQAHFSETQDGGRSEIVEVLTLDELWRAKVISRLDFIKCDVEGAELGIIEGGMSLMEAQLPGWLLEVSRDTSSEVFRILRDLGYRSFVYDGCLVPTENYRDKEFSNYFFLHPASGVWQRALPLVRSPGRRV